MESLEEMQSRHRKEQKDLQSRITQKKKGATKKTRKGINFECEELERQLKQEQEQELATLSGDAVPNMDDVPELDEPLNEELKTNGVNGVADSLERTTISAAPSDAAHLDRKSVV